MIHEANELVRVALRDAENLRDLGNGERGFHRLRHDRYSARSSSRAKNDARDFGSH